MINKKIDIQENLSEFVSIITDDMVKGLYDNGWLEFWNNEEAKQDLAKALNDYIKCGMNKGYFYFEDDMDDFDISKVDKVIIDMKFGNISFYTIGD